MPAAPASNAGGSATITYSRQPTSQHSPPTSTASAMSVPMTLRRIRGRAFRAGILGPTHHRHHRPEAEHDRRVAEQPVGRGADAAIGRHIRRP